MRGSVKRSRGAWDCFADRWGQTGSRPEPFELRPPSEVQERPMGGWGSLPRNGTTQSNPTAGHYTRRSVTFMDINDGV